MPKHSAMDLKFEPIDLNKQERYQELLASCPQVSSDYSFLNLWAWSEDYNLQWAWEDDLVWIKQARPEPLFWAPLGPWNSVNWSNRYHRHTDQQTVFIRVPKVLVECWRATMGDETIVTEERDHWDYQYDVAELIELKGNRYHKKKNLLNQFVKKYNFRYQPFGPELIEQAMGMQEDWCTWRDCESSDVLSAENKAIARVLADWRHFSGVLGGALMVNGDMVAYTVAEGLTRDSIVIHFEKGDTQYKGVYQAINQMFLANSASGYKLVNREQDLGDEGLRKAKLSYHPTSFISKYRVTMPWAL
ncbi:MAG: phosphatidylglycerol lysyltransferase domain-containing protein [Desulfobacterales bacterium]|nr:phosphatidylglycerol lysyltransferase domain-containing protein [Desulfobacterales bacterium]